MSIESSPEQIPPNPAQTEFQLGQQAFESGEYRQSVQALERSLAMAAAGSVLQGDIQIWLVMAYEAAGDRVKARQLCKATVRHPQLATRKDAKGLLYILEAPELRRRDDWVTKIPNLEGIPSRNEKAWAAPAPTKLRNKPKEKPQGYVIPEPTDPTKVEIEDRGFVWLALIGSTIVVLGLIWFA
jgi:hypothetical protein